MFINHQRSDAAGVGGKVFMNKLWMEMPLASRWKIINIMEYIVVQVIRWNCTKSKFSISFEGRSHDMSIVCEYQYIVEAYSNFDRLLFFANSHRGWIQLTIIINYQWFCIRIINSILAIFSKFYPERFPSLSIPVDHRFEHCEISPPILLHYTFHRIRISKNVAPP